MSLLRTAAKVSVATRVHGNAQRRQQQRWAQQDQAAAPPVQTAPPPAAAGSSMEDKLAQLKQLGDLRDAGILSEAEFEVKKAQILNS